jgi:hypothetical protein
MEILAKRHQFNEKSSKGSARAYVVIGLLLLVVGVILLVVGIINNNYVKQISIPFFVLGILLFLLSFLYRARVKSAFSGPSDFVIFEEETGKLQLYPQKSEPVTENIRNLTNVSSYLSRTRYAMYTFGTLILEFGSKKYTFTFVADLHEASTKIIIYKEKYKK